MEALQGYKTYICAALAAVVTLTYALNMISQSTWQILMGLLVPAAAAALKSSQLAQTAKIMAQAKAVEARESSCPPGA